MPRSRGASYSATRLVTPSGFPRGTLGQRLRFRRSCITRCLSAMCLASIRARSLCAFRSVHARPPLFANAALNRLALSRPTAFSRNRDVDDKSAWPAALVRDAVKHSHASSLVRPSSIAAENQPVDALFQLRRRFTPRTHCQSLAPVCSGHVAGIRAGVNRPLDVHAGSMAATEPGRPGHGIFRRAVVPVRGCWGLCISPDGWIAGKKATK